MSGRLDGKVAVITGGCSGMGLGTLELFLEEGARVVLADIQGDKGEALAAKHGERLRFIRCDIRSEADVAAAIALAESAFGRLDILFNNAAAAGATGGIETLDVDAWDATHALVLRSVMLGCKHAVPAMRRAGGGAIINTASGTAVLPFGNRGAAYGTMKAGVAHISRLLASELGPDRIRVNAIVPGWIATSILGNSIGASREVADRMTPYLLEDFATFQPLPDAGTPRDIGEAVLFLGSDAAKWITGVVLPVDGGLLVKNQADGRLPDILQNARTKAEQALADGAPA